MFVSLIGLACIMLLGLAHVGTTDALLCGLTSAGGFVYDFSPFFSEDVTTLPGSIAPDGYKYTFNLCGTKSTCGDDIIACQLGSQNVALGYRDTLRFSFLDYNKPQLGIVAKTTQTPKAPVSCYRELVILFVCGNDAYNTSSAFSAIQTADTFGQYGTTCFHNFIVPTSIMCQNVKKN